MASGFRVKHRPRNSGVARLPSIIAQRHRLEVAKGNLATPLFLGRCLTLNPLAILLTFLLWFYLWGVAGTLLAVPLLATFRYSLIELSH